MCRGIFRVCRALFPKCRALLFPTFPLSTWPTAQIVGLVKEVGEFPTIYIYTKR